MINDGNAGNGGQINPPATAQISAKEFGAKFKSKRGKWFAFRVPKVDTLYDKQSVANNQQHSSAELLFDSGPFNW